MEYLPLRWMSEAERKRCCVYCGVPIRSGYTCRAHSDLPRTDPVLTFVKGGSGDEAA